VASPKLDQSLLNKVAEKTGRPGELQYVRNRLLRMAKSHGISSPAALLILARDLGIGYQSALRKLDSHQRAEVSRAFSANYVTPKETKGGSRAVSIKVPTSGKAGIGEVTQLVLKDTELSNRVRDLIRAARNYDRPISEATKVLESRIRKKAKPPGKMSGDALVAYAFNEEIAKTRLKMSNEPDEQRGYTQIMRGIVAAFRNPTHHDIVDTFSQEDALKICAFIDLMLPIVDNAENTSK
jgi:uncharacterized protein (TIGR02391 family)